MAYNEFLGERIGIALKRKGVSLKTACKVRT
jgi:hypothetical protein